MEREKKRGNLLENLFIVILAFYPLRHISWGLDLWDTGYNYANFQYMGMEHMDPMWLFSTYLANAVGNLLMKLPRADSLIGMNFYTGLLVSALALAGYFFCVKKLKMPEWIAFLGEFVAVSLCWCPTAVLYNYLTYVLFLGCVILLYEGLTKDRPICLMLAGICLGANVLVRFSNLPQAAMILAVWAYDGADWYQERGRAGKGEESLFRRLGQHTFWCFAGYGSALLALFSYLHIRYGMANYVAGIKRLFSMTENASAYKAASMVRNTFEEYAENLYWVFRIGIILAAGLVLFAVSGRFMEKIWNITSGKAPERGAAKALWRGIRILWGAVSAAVPAWLYIRGFCSLEFLQNGPIQYGPMQRPGILFLTLTLVICAVRFFHKGSAKEERLISAMVALVVLITPLGSNNRLMPSLNNLFVAAPYTFWQSFRFCKNVTERRIGKITVNAFPAKSVLCVFLLFCVFQFAGFGVKFSFAESTGVYQLTACVEGNEILRNIKMNPQKAEWITELMECVEKQNLQGREVILYGGIPALSYYLQMPPAFNSWSDLVSYSYETMEAALLQTEDKLRKNGKERPIVLVNRLFNGWTKDYKGLEQDEKWQLISDYMDRNGYTLTWQNDKFALYE